MFFFAPLAEKHQVALGTTNDSLWPFRADTAFIFYPFLVCAAKKPNRPTNSDVATSHSPAYSGQIVFAVMATPASAPGTVVFQSFIF
jgi:hypothetical protein